MLENWPFPARPDLTPADYLAEVGKVSAIFGPPTQASGNVSFAVDAAGRRWFVKTAGDPAHAESFLNHAERVALLRNAQHIAGSVTHHALPPLRAELTSVWGPMLIYGWASGELLGGAATERADPASAHQRFRRLPANEITAALGSILDAHVALCAAGWVACDFYDGSIIYDFATGQMSLVDLDAYRRGPFVNEMGRMFGSTRFMAPEELALGAMIDERTTVFTLGRMISIFLGDSMLEPTAFRGTPIQMSAMAKACRPDPSERFASVATLVAAWRG